MQDIATKVSFAGSLLTTPIKISTYTKHVQLVLDITSVVGLMSHKKKEDSAQ